MGKKVFFVTTHPIQYIVPLYQEIQKDGEINFEVVYCTDETIKGSYDKHFGRTVKWDLPLLDGYKYTFLKNISWKPSLNSGFFGLINFEIVSFLRKAPHNSLIIISGWSNVTYILTIIFSKLFGHKIALRTEAPIAKETNRKGIVNYLRKKFLKFCFKYFIDFGLYIGTQNKKFFEFYKVSKDRLFFTPYCVDNHRFYTEYKNLMPERSKIRSEIGVNQDAFVVLFTGKFYDVKRPFDLIHAFEQLEIQNKHLIMVGDGIMRSELQSYVKDRGIKNVLFPGFINQTKISSYYIVSDVFVLCSESETWGLSINEAMNFGLPVLAYDSVGCSEDLIVNGENGFIIKKGNIQELSKSLKKTFYDDKLKINSRKLAHKIINEYSYENNILGIKAAIL